MRAALILPVILFGGLLQAQERSDTLRGSIGPYRAWWDVVHYYVTVRPDFASKSIQGSTIITFQAIAEGQRLQIDLQQPLVVDSIVSGAGTPRSSFKREGNVVWVDLPEPVAVGTRTDLKVYYHGKPREARMPPWDGGWIWRTDAEGHPWMSVACQGLGASAWYPCKDHQSDEPLGAQLHIVVPEGLVGVGNGRSQGSTSNADGTTTWHWQVTSPINTYNLVPYIGKYVRFGEEYTGLAGRLDLSYWVLEHNEAKARTHFRQVPGMLTCFEQWFGPYPFYADGYQLVEAPHLGMEHQSAVAYGNGYRNGYMGRDLSGTGHGDDWDYIIIHESGHEWFGNSITTADIADMWVHEGFTNYTEAVYVECMQGAQAAEEYVIGLRRNIRNDKPILGPPGVNQEGSGDMYYKGSNLIHTIRKIIGDSLFKALLLDMNARFRHQVVTSAGIEAYISDFSGKDLHPVFDQYLRTTRVPVLQWAVHKKQLRYRWVETGSAFNMPVDVRIDGRTIRLEPTIEWKTLTQHQRIRDMKVAPGYYVQERRVDFAPPKVRTVGTPVF